MTCRPQIFGNPVKRFAHQADVLRLELLLQFGGVYLDLDVLLLRSRLRVHAHVA